MASTISASLECSPQLTGMNGFMEPSVLLENDEQVWMLTLPTKIEKIQKRNNVMFQILQEQQNAIAQLFQELSSNVLRFHDSNIRAAMKEQGQQPTAKMKLREPSPAPPSSPPPPTLSNAIEKSSAVSQATTGTVPPPTRSIPPSSSTSDHTTPTVLNLLLEMGYVRVDVEAALKSLNIDPSTTPSSQNLESIMAWIAEGNNKCEERGQTEPTTSVDADVNSSTFQNGREGKKATKKKKKKRNKVQQAQEVLDDSVSCAQVHSNGTGNNDNETKTNIKNDKWEEMERLSREAEERARREWQLERQRQQREEEVKQQKQEQKHIIEHQKQHNQKDQPSSESKLSSQISSSSSKAKGGLVQQSPNENNGIINNVKLVVAAEGQGTTMKMSANNQAMRRHKQTEAVEPSRLSQFMYPQVGRPASNTTNHIFSMMQDPGSIEVARKLLRLEDKMAKQERTNQDKYREKKQLEEKISNLAEEEADLELELERKIGLLNQQLKMATEKFKNLKKTEKLGDMKQVRLEAERFLEEREKNKLHLPKKMFESSEKDCKKYLRIIDDYDSKTVNIPKQIAEERLVSQAQREKLQDEKSGLMDQLKKQEAVIRMKEKLLKKTHEEVARWTGQQELEDSHFDINLSRNDHGLTFLMICAQNNDLETAELCFELGADVDVKCPSGLTALSYARYMQHVEMINCLIRNGGTDPLVDSWNDVEPTTSAATRPVHRVDWEAQLRIAERAAIPADTKMASSDEGFTSNSIEDSDLSAFGVDQSCFDASLLDSSSCHFRRVALMEASVYQWFMEAEESQQSNLVRLIEKLRDATPVVFHRKFIVGVKRAKQFVIFCATLDQEKTPPPQFRKKVPTVSHDDFVLFYSPYIESFVDGVANVGVLLWAVTTESQALNYKQLIEGAEFRRHKVHDAEDRWPPHQDYILELGKDMHLLDLMGTSIFSGKAMELLRMNLDDNDLERLRSSEPDFKPKKRLLEYEQHLQNAIFRSSKQESMEHNGLLKDSLTNKSTNISGGAGTGKTLTMIKKVVSEDPTKKMMVLSRLPRLVAFVKSTVQEERDISNIDFFTYDELLAAMTRAITPNDPDAKRTFSAFSHVGFLDSATIGGTSSSISFEDCFVKEYLEAGERRRMDSHSIKAVTLWEAFRVIKSSAQCARTKAPLTREQYSNLPMSYGLKSVQRTVVYDLFERYEEWMGAGSFKWDEADRTLYVFRFGPSVFVDEEFIPWVERAYQHGEDHMLDDNDMPLAPFFYHAVFADEAQDFSELDLSLFIRMAGSIRSLFFGADPAQSVEVGVRMRAGTVNSVFHSSLPLTLRRRNNIQVKDVLQELTLKTNHRTHARNLAMAQSIRKIMIRSFGVPGSTENALMEGPIPEGLRITSLEHLTDKHVFVGGNVVFIAPDEIVGQVRSSFLHLNIKNDVFGVRDAKGLEFSSVGLIGFFTYFEQVGSSKPWENVLRWLFSNTGVTTKQSSERVQGKVLEDCDYALSHPELEDQAMMLYTAITRCKGNLYLIESENGLIGDADVKSKKTSKKGKGWAEFAFRQFKDLRLIKLVTFIDEGEVDMTPQQHKSRGIQVVVQAINMDRNGADVESVRKKFAEAAERFCPDKGNDQHLFDQCHKHRDAITDKRNIRTMVKKSFFNHNGQYDLRGRFKEILQFEKALAKFLKLCENDTFLIDEIQEVRVLCEEIFFGTPYEAHFAKICNQMKQMKV